MAFLFLTLRDGRHLDEIAKNKNYIIERKKIYHNIYSVDGNPTDQKVGMDVAVIYYKNPKTGEKMPFMLEYLGEKKYSDIVTGNKYEFIEHRPRNIKGSAIDYCISDDSDTVYSSAIARRLKTMDKSDLNVYEKRLQELDKLLFYYYIGLERQMEVKKQDKKPSASDEYIRQFIKNRNSGK